MSWDYEVGVAVVGAGACGLMAAVRSADGVLAPVAVFERSTRLLSNAEISSGTLAAGGTRFQRALDVDDSPEKHASDILRKNGGRSDPDVTHAVCRAAPRYVEWLADGLGHPLELATDLTRVGHSAPRLHADRARMGGRSLVEAMRRAAQCLSKIVLVDNTPGLGLLADDDEVTGVRILENGAEKTVRAGATVLACGGFGANREMVAQHILAMADAAYIGVEGSQGDAIRWAVELGAATDHLPAYQGHGHVVKDHGTRLNPGIPLAGGITVNQSGRRFTREDLGYSEFAPLVLAQPDGVAVEIWDEQIMESVRNSEMMRESAAAGGFATCAEWSDLAAAFDLPLDVLLDEVAQYHRGVESGRDPLGRTVTGKRLTPPLYGALITGGLAHTQGGLRVDPVGRVLRSNGQAIRNLYAGGGAAAGLSGDEPGGYLSGNGLLAALGMGYLIGNHLAAGGARAG